MRSFSHCFVSHSPGTGLHPEGDASKPAQENPDDFVGLARGRRPYAKAEAAALLVCDHGLPASASKPTRAVLPRRREQRPTRKHADRRRPSQRDPRQQSAAGAAVGRRGAVQVLQRVQRAAADCHPSGVGPRRLGGEVDLRTQPGSAGGDRRGSHRLPVDWPSESVLLQRVHQVHGGAATTNGAKHRDFPEDGRVREQGRREAVRILARETVCSQVSAASCGLCGDVL